MSLSFLAKGDHPASLQLVTVMAFTPLLLRTFILASIFKHLTSLFLAAMISLIKQATQCTGTSKNYTDNAAKGKNYEEFCGKIVSFYKDYLNVAELQVQLQNLGTWFSSKGSNQAEAELRVHNVFERPV